MSEAGVCSNCTCERFSENLWRKHICGNCLHSKSDHNFVSSAEPSAAPPAKEDAIISNVMKRYGASVGNLRAQPLKKDPPAPALAPSPVLSPAAPPARSPSPSPVASPFASVRSLRPPDLLLDSSTISLSLMTLEILTSPRDFNDSCASLAELPEVPSEAHKRRPAPPTPRSEPPIHTPSVTSLNSDSVTSLDSGSITSLTSSGPKERPSPPTLGRPRATSDARSALLLSLSELAGGEKPDGLEVAGLEYPLSARDTPTRPSPAIRRKRTSSASSTSYQSFISSTTAIDQNLAHKELHQISRDQPNHSSISNNSSNSNIDKNNHTDPISHSKEHRLSSKSKSRTQLSEPFSSLLLNLPSPAYARIFHFAGREAVAALRRTCSALSVVASPFLGLPEPTTGLRRIEAGVLAHLLAHPPGPSGSVRMLSVLHARDDVPQVAVRLGEKKKSTGERRRSDSEGGECFVGVFHISAQRKHSIGRHGAPTRVPQRVPFALMAFHGDGYLVAGAHAGRLGSGLGWLSVSADIFSMGRVVLIPLGEWGDETVLHVVVWDALSRDAALTPLRAWPFVRSAEGQWGSRRGCFKVEVQGGSRVAVVLAQEPIGEDDTPGAVVEYPIAIGFRVYGPDWRLLDGMQGECRRTQSVHVHAQVPQDVRKVYVEPYTHEKAEGKLFLDVYAEDEVKITPSKVSRRASGKKKSLKEKKEKKEK